MRTVEIIVSGRVQGVFYRQSTGEKAAELGLTGSVENMENGEVRIIVSGPADAVNKMIEWSKTGPPRARVIEVGVTEVDYREFEGFRVLR